MYSVHLKCNYDTTFQLIFTEKIGNNYQNVIHLFHKDINSIFILSTVYIQTSNRNGIHLLYSHINSIKLSDYSGSILKEYEYKEVYKFSGFQEGKTPVIDPYFLKIKNHSPEKHVLADLSNEFVLNFIIKNIAINKKNISKYNDIGFYLEKSGLYSNSIYLLKKVIIESPNRTVAYLNLGEAYWGLGNQEKAREAYNMYVHQMRLKNLEKKIPERILERINKY